jgi:hypothetical protein
MSFAQLQQNRMGKSRHAGTHATRTYGSSLSDTGRLIRNDSSNH